MWICTNVKLYVGYHFVGIEDSSFICVSYRMVTILLLVQVFHICIFIDMGKRQEPSPQGNTCHAPDHTPRVSFLWYYRYLNSHTSVMFKNKKSFIQEMWDVRKSYMDDQFWGPSVLPGFNIKYKFLIYKVNRLPTGLGFVSLLVFFVNVLDVLTWSYHLLFSTKDRLQWYCKFRNWQPLQCFAMD